MTTHRFIWSIVEQMRISFYYNTKTFYYPDISISIRGLHQKRHWITIYNVQITALYLRISNFLVKSLRSHIAIFISPNRISTIHNTTRKQDKGVPGKRKFSAKVESYLEREWRGDQCPSVSAGLDASQEQTGRCSAYQQLSCHTDSCSTNSPELENTDNVSVTGRAVTNTSFYYLAEQRIYDYYLAKYE